MSNFGNRLGYILSGNSNLRDRVMPTMKPQNAKDAADMEGLEIAVLLVPDIGEVELLGDGLEAHHLLPQEFKEIFEAEGVGLKVEDYTITIRRSKHRLRIGKGLHTNLSPGGNWNKIWEKFLRDETNRTAPRILDQMHKMVLDAFHNGTV
jgi:hypothetical protein